MAYSIYAILQDGTREQAGKFVDLCDAADEAFRIADDDVAYASIGDPPRPDRICVYRGAKLELSVKVRRGGLLGNRGAPILRSM